MLHDNFHGKRKKIINNSNYNNANLVSLWFRQITLYYLNLLKKGLERINLLFCHFERFFPFAMEIIMNLVIKYKKIIIEK